MAESALTKKLLLKPGMSTLLIGAPDGFGSMLGPSPRDATLSRKRGEQHDFVLLFAPDKAALEMNAAAALAALKQGGLFWVAFPKGSSKLQSDLTRDQGWDALTGRGLRIVTLVSIDEMWSAARIRPGVQPRREGSDSSG